MLYRILADTVVIVHLGFIVFVAVGALLTWRWPALVWAHVPALAWGAGTVILGLPCPLTALEKGLRSLGGERAYLGGFVDHYLKGVVYPGRYTWALRGLVVVAVLVGYVGVWRRRTFREVGAGAALGSGVAVGEQRAAERSVRPAPTKGGGGASTICESASPERPRSR